MGKISRELASAGNISGIGYNICGFEVAVLHFASFASVCSMYLEKVPPIHELGRPVELVGVSSYLSESSNTII